MPPKAQSKYNKGVPKPESGRPIESLGNIHDTLEAGKKRIAELKKGKSLIDKDNSIPTFKQLIRQLNEAEDDAGVEHATKAMGGVVQSLIRESMGDKNYQRAIENIGTLRQACIDLEVPELYNDFLRDLKQKILSNALGEKREDMWNELRITARGSLGLITESQSEVSNITEDQAKQVRTKWNSRSRVREQANVSCSAVLVGWQVNLWQTITHASSKRCGIGEVRAGLVLDTPEVEIQGF